MKREQLEAPAKAMGIAGEELEALAKRGEEKAYEGGACLFHESTPREWFGLVAEGEVEIVRGLHGRQTHLATLAEGALISEGILLDDTAHAASAFARGTATRVLQIP